jgi:hypothetical protein
MRLVLRFMGMELLSFGPESDGDEQTQAVWIDGTGGSFELATDDYSGQGDDEQPEETFGFGGR